MQIILPSYDALLLRKSIFIEHAGQQLEWSVAPFNSGNFERDVGMFHHINQWWARQTEHAQKEIFDIYVDIYNAFTTTLAVDTLDAKLFDLIKRLYNKHQFEDIYHWMSFSSDIRFPGPPELLPEFVESIDKNHSRDKTYTIDDYKKLVCLIIQLRLMIPIWGEYIARTENTSGTQFKEYYAYQLLSRSNLFTSEALIKLTIYVSAIVPKEGSKSAIIEFISSEDFPVWNLGLLVVRRLCLADIRGHDPSPILVRHISRHVRERVKRSDNSFKGGMIREKLDLESQGSDENQISRMEGYKIKPEISIGEIALIEHLVADPYAVAQSLVPGIDPKVVAEALQSASIMQQYQAEEAQTLLLQWVFATVIPPEGVELLNQKQRINCLCVTQAVLWHHGHELLAGLATATVTPTINGDVHLSGGYSKGRINKELSEKLTELYPYQKKTRGGKVINGVLQAIDEMVDLFMSVSWTVNVSPEKTAILNPRTPSVRRITIPHDFKTKVAELVVYLATRPRLNKNYEAIQ